ncbi:MAG: glycosyltransferase [Candidatus Omnitrophota bacterium]|nr:MAG: glycosyltransferase [Candidatus Omnitrophota bacterium]
MGISGSIIVVLIFPSSITKIKDSNLPFISVIVPVYNGERTIEECINSLLNQDYPKDKYEIIIVDNGSKDKTAEIVIKYPVNYLLENKIQSSYTARNAGVKSSKGEILAFTDADCVADKEWLMKGSQGFSTDETGCVVGEIKGSKPTNYVEEYLINKKELSQNQTLRGAFLPYPKTANVFYRKETFEKIGFFEEKWESGGDADFAWRMQLETDYKIKFVPKAIIYHKHRSTIGAMFKQCIKWGVGHTLLYKKYKKILPKRTLKQVVWIFQRMIYASIKGAIFLFLEKGDMDKKKRDKYFDFISFTGWEVGRIIGSIRNKVFYI